MLSQTAFRHMRVRGRPMQEQVREWFEITQSYTLPIQSIILKEQTDRQLSKCYINRISKISNINHYTNLDNRTIS